MEYLIASVRAEISKIAKSKTPVPKPKPKVFTKNKSKKAAVETIYWIIPNCTKASIRIETANVLIMPLFVGFGVLLK